MDKHVIETVFDVSFPDYPHHFSEDTHIPKEDLWHTKGLDNVLDSIVAAGSQRIHFRVHAAGPWWPTRIKGAEPRNWDGYAGQVGLTPLFSQWNVVKAAVEAAHHKGITIIAWFDLTDGHAGLPAKWALDHPQYCIVDRQGRRLDGPVGIVGHHGVRFEKTKQYTYHQTLIDEGFMDLECLRPDGATIDPQLSLAYPQVVDYRLSLIKELLEFGVDGLYLVTNTPVGYEQPARRRFTEIHGSPPEAIGESDVRWIRHQQEYFTAFIRLVRDLMRDAEKTTGRKLEFTLEGQGQGPCAHYQEIGWPRIPPWANMPAFVDVQTIARDQLVDCIAFWRFAEIDNLSDKVRSSVKIATRYRATGLFNEEQFRKRREEADKRGVSYLVLNEPRNTLAKVRWIYPAKPGPLLSLAEQAQRLQSSR